ncbi:MAG: hypothetical protein IPO08_19950 [Xanthomonadales bacterium]|nr:hypothetical protein [Xanthomonadales bacterium]
MPGSKPALNAREASTDFQRRGTSLPTMGVMWSFLHAGLQGMDLSRRVLFSAAASRTSGTTG